MTNFRYYPEFCSQFSKTNKINLENGTKTSINAFTADFVQFVSDNDVGFLDPHEAQFRDPKNQLTFNYTWNLRENHDQAYDFQDQWEPFIHDIFGLGWEHFDTGKR